MARIRTVKPEFWTDEKVGECSVSARLLFVATWNFADDHGGLDRSSKQIKAQAFPYDKIDCEPLINELLKVGVLVEYESSGKKYLHIKNFQQHQKIDKPSKPRVPLYESSLKTHLTLAEPSESTRPSSLGREGSLKEGNMGNGSARTSRAPTAKRIPDDFKLTDELRAIALAEAVDAEREFAKFTDYWRSASGANARKHDWEATWRNWCRKASEISRGNSRSPPTGARTWDQPGGWRPTDEESGPC